MSTQDNKKGDWIKAKHLGAGAFGIVDLWKNQITGDEIALKMCKFGLSQNQHDRWRDEVQRMKNFDHRNIIKVLQAPLELQGTSIVMAMEYCRGGDLRQALSRAEHCCGFPEKEVRNIVMDLASGIEYLQTLKTCVIHRDLKPENIVIQPFEERTVYKIIDLGFAKEINPESEVTMSTVGTPEYLAPEFKENHRHFTKTVDYWSMGMVVFECISGFRPFLPDLTQCQSYQKIRNKTPNDIYIYETDDKRTIYSQNLPPYIHIHRTLRSYFEEWLKLMLRFDGRTRGGVLSNNKRQRCFVYLDNILAKKMLHVLSVPTNQLLTYPLDDGETLKGKINYITEETKIPPEEQDMLLINGQAPNFDLPLSNYTDADIVIFMFRSKLLTAETMKRPLPTNAKELVLDPKIGLNHQKVKRAYSESVFYCQELSVDLENILNSLSAYLLCLWRWSECNKNQKNKMKDLHNLLEFSTDSLVNSIDLDIHFSKDAIENFHVTEYIKKWKSLKSSILEYKITGDKTIKLEQDVAELKTKFITIDKLAEKADFLKHMNESKNKVIEEYNNYKSRTRASKHRFLVNDHSAIVTGITKCITYWKQALDYVFSKLNELMSIRRDFQKQNNEMVSFYKQMSLNLEEIQKLQKERHFEFWTVLSNMVKQNKGILPALSSEDIRSLSNINKLLIDSKDVCERSDMLIKESSEASKRLEVFINSEFPDISSSPLSAC